MTGFRTFLLVGLAACSCLGAEKESVRTWKDASGNFQIDARLVGYESGVVQLKKGDGTELKVPFSRLSEEDREHVRRYVEARRPAQPDSGRKPRPRASKESAAAKEPDPTPAKIELPKDRKSRLSFLRDYPEWRKVPVAASRVAQWARQLASGNSESQAEALEQLALAQPDPTMTKQLMTVVHPLMRSPPDDYHRSLAGVVCKSWEYAERAATTLAAAGGSRGNYSRLEAMLTSPDRQAQKRAIEALSITADPTAAEILANHWMQDILVIPVALERMGPVAAPAVTRWLEVSDRGLDVRACKILEEIGTSAEIPALEAKLNSGERGFFSRRSPNNPAQRAIDAIRKSDRG